MYLQSDICCTKKLGGTRMWKEETIGIPQEDGTNHIIHFWGSILRSRAKSTALTAIGSQNST